MDIETDEYGVHITSTMRFLKPTKLGVASEPEVRVDGLDLQWIAERCLYLTLLRLSPIADVLSACPFELGEAGMLEPVKCTSGTFCIVVGSIIKNHSNDMEIMLLL